MFLIMVAALGLGLGSVPAATAQVAPPSVLEIQFFNAIGGETTTYLVRPTALLHTPEGNFLGHAGLAEFGATLAGSFADLVFTAVSMAQAGDLTIIAFTISGIHIDAYHGAVSDCAQVAVPAVAVLRVKKPGVSSTYWTDGAMSLDPEMGPESEYGLVTEQWIGYDGDAIVRQIATFNTIDPALTTGCAEYFGLQPAPAN